MSQYWHLIGTSQNEEEQVQNFRPLAAHSSRRAALSTSFVYEEVYLHAYKSVPEARAGIGRYLAFYNGRRPHSSLDRKIPDQVYFNQPQPIPLAA